MAELLRYAYYDQQLKCRPCICACSNSPAVDNMYGTTAHARPPILLLPVRSVEATCPPATVRLATAAAAATGATDITAKTATSALRWKQRADWLTDRLDCRSTDGRRPAGRLIDFKLQGARPTGMLKTFGHTKQTKS